MHTHLQLLEKDPNKRLGHLGADEVKKHVIFKDINWIKLYKKEIEPVYKPFGKSNPNIKYNNYKCFDDSYLKEKIEIKNSLSNESNIGFEIFKDFEHFPSIGITWDFERLIWIGFEKNQNNDECLLSQLPKEIIVHILTFLKL